MTAATGMTTRYGELTYTCFADAGNAGGWQVKETVGGITDTEANLLVEGIHTDLSPVEPLPRYPTPEQLAAFPRRLSYRRLDRATAAYWHVAPAGLDSSGRPGNVFAHAVLDRRAATTEPRPIELWHSPHWLTPYGCKAVLAATLCEAEPVTGNVVTAESVLGFVCELGAQRLSVLCVLLDAVATAMAGGPLTVLGAESVADAAAWIGAVSFLMSSAAARRLNFSTFDRGSGLRNAPRAGRHLVAVPRRDLPDVPDGLLVIDEAEMVAVGELDGRPHRTARGPVAATAWSMMARIVLGDRTSAAQVLADVDRPPSAMGDSAADADLQPALAMAFAVLGRPASADAAAAARAVIAAHADRALRTEPSAGDTGSVRDCVSTLLRAADSAALRDLALWVLGANANANVDAAAVACAVVRALPPADWLANGYIQSHYRAYAPYWDKVIREFGVAAVHRDFAVRFLVLGALAAASGIAEAAACRALASDRALVLEATRELESIVAADSTAAGG